MDIEKIAYDYLNSSEETPAKKTIRRTRKALQNSYENNKQKYVYEKGIVDAIMKEATELERQYQSHKAKMESFYNKMLELRNLINKIDDDGVSYIELERTSQQEGDE